LDKKADNLTWNSCNLLETLLHPIYFKAIREAYKLLSQSCYGEGALFYRTAYGRFPKAEKISHHPHERAATKVGKGGKDLLLASHVEPQPAPLTHQPLSQKLYKEMYTAFRQTKGFEESSIIVEIERICSILENPLNAQDCLGCLDFLDIFDVIHALNLPVTRVTNKASPRG
jgi:hypothetical protein